MKQLVGGIVGVIVISAVGYLYVSHTTTVEYQEQVQYNPPMQPADTTADIISHTATFEDIAPGVQVAPVEHASAVLWWDTTLVFIDPVGPASQYRQFGTPDIVVVTHRHEDHFDQENLPTLVGEETALLTTPDVIKLLPPSMPGTIIDLAPGDTQTIEGLTFTALPAYNLRPEAEMYHPRSRQDIGVVLSAENTRVYFSGDTEGIPEMLALKDIDAAFVAMNLPFTMGVEAAAEAVAAFAPKTVYPYHFKTPDGFSDIGRFQELVESANPSISVKMLEWYPE